ncbi:glycoside hydrolase [Fomitiporia mediterranea MF3/22]|uniref:glycoside hydrolase n=1 Tax=Fomitiporia mediterranea (strain MF3/22) TaxID=694068 RepID=UPI0004408516|nr:glycoside hydrolase [Fomitiporia mediterranea MF3/22]EJC98222.1 glycoside hydrolase [Fomitiporia mediterranea MF3/22]
MVSLSFAALSLLSLVHAAVGFDISRNDNLVLYWGQNSYGATHSDVANFQKRLGFYCTSDSVTDTFPLAFLTAAFGEGGLPSIDLSNICNQNDNATFPGTQLPNCAALAPDIESCQAAGKIVTLSIGGATGAIGFTSDSQAETFADTIWNVFLGGSSSTRPFGAAVLDGIDLDIEGGGSSGYAAFVTRIRSHAQGANKKYFITAAPQCPFPDANLGAVINAVGFDAVYVQFYNNFCGLQNFNNPNAWNFAQWDDWAHNTSPNKNVKVYIGAPASSTAAGSGFVDAGTLASIVKTTQSQFSSFGGVMMWDASQAYANSRYDIAAKNAMTGGNVPVPPSSSSSTRTTSSTRSTSTSSSTAVPTAGSCAGVAPWSSSIAYNGGSQVTFNGHLWTAKWWSQADQPGGAADDWTDNGPCTNARFPAPTATSSHEAAPSPSASVKPSSATAATATSSAVESHSARQSSAVATSSVVHSSASAISAVTKPARLSASHDVSPSSVASAPAVSASTKEGRALRFNRNNVF